MNYTTQQWQMIDSIPDRDLAKLMDKLTKTKLVPGSDWYQLCCINIQWNERQFMTKKQKRWVACLVLDHWDDLEVLMETYYI
jgi:hypothetical protein